MSIFLVGIVCALVSGWITSAVRKYALRHDVLDHPNERSSHVAPVPRGGGLAITAVTLTAVVLMYALGAVEREFALAIVGGGGLVAWIGWRDDHSSISAGARALVHFASAAWALFWLEGFPSLRIGTQSIALGWVGALFAAIGIVWLLNLYNFMDGIDGIAGMEGLSVAAMGATISVIMGANQIGLVSAALAGGCAGFLVWNWAPAKIFMGDVGSGFVGYALAVTAVASERDGGPALIIWALLLGAFIFDATVTLIRRILRGERWAVAHRRHAYQRAVSSGFNHRQVTAAYLAISFLLFGIAYWISIRPDRVVHGMVAALLALAGGYLCVEVRRPMFDPLEKAVARQ